MRQPGIVSYVDVGCAVYSTERTRATSVDEVPVGGLVVAVTESFDADTGEVDRSFLCVDHQQTRPRLFWSVVREAEVDRAVIEAVDTSVLCRLWRRLAEEICSSAPHKFRRGPATPTEVRCARAILELQAVVFGRDATLHAELDRGVTLPDTPMTASAVNVAALVD